MHVGGWGSKMISGKGLAPVLQHALEFGCGNQELRNILWNPGEPERLHRGIEDL
jgi:hypothetical protein